MKSRRYLFAWGMLVLGTLIGAIISIGITSAQTSQPQQVNKQTTQTTQRWEYEIVFGREKNGAEAQKELNRLGELGYEAAGYSTSADENGKQNFSVLLKRAKGSEGTH